MLHRDCSSDSAVGAYMPVRVSSWLTAASVALVRHLHEAV